MRTLCWGRTLPALERRWVPFALTRQTGFNTAEIFPGGDSSGRDSSVVGSSSVGCRPPQAGACASQPRPTGRGRAGGAGSCVVHPRGLRFLLSCPTCAQAPPGACRSARCCAGRAVPTRADSGGWPVSGPLPENPGSLGRRALVVRVGGHCRLPRTAVSLNQAPKAGGAAPADCITAPFLP